jgi:hypothetical protein
LPAPSTAAPAKTTGGDSSEARGGREDPRRHPRPRAHPGADDAVQRRAEQHARGQCGEHEPEQVRAVEVPEVHGHHHRLQPAEGDGEPQDEPDRAREEAAAGHHEHPVGELAQHGPARGTIGGRGAEPTRQQARQRRGERGGRRGDPQDRHRLHDGQQPAGRGGAEHERDRGQALAHSHHALEVDPGMPGDLRREDLAGGHPGHVPEGAEDAQQDEPHQVQAEQQVRERERRDGRGGDDVGDDRGGAPVDAVDDHAAEESDRDRGDRGRGREGRHAQWAAGGLQDDQGQGDGRDAVAEQAQEMGGVVREGDG